MENCLFFSDSNQATGVAMICVLLGQCLDKNRMVQQYMPISVNVAADPATGYEPGRRLLLSSASASLSASSGAGGEMRSGGEVVSTLWSIWPCTTVSSFGGRCFPRCPPSFSLPVVGPSQAVLLVPWSQKGPSCPM